MCVNTMSEWNDLQMRIHGEAERPSLIYLPGLHGDWTLVSSFRMALGDRVRFVEVTYPRTVTWTLDDYARAVLDALAGHGVREGWLLAESFSSVVAYCSAPAARAASMAPCAWFISLLGGSAHARDKVSAIAIPQRTNRRSMRW